VTWPPPELVEGAEVGVLRPDDEELLEEVLPDVPEDVPPDEPDVALVPDVPLVLEVPLVPEPDVAWCEVLELAAVAAPGSVNAMAPAPIRLAAAAEAVTARSRVLPRSRSLTPGGVLCLRWLMASESASPALGSSYEQPLS
jgi:hypothetical protein